MKFQASYGQIIPASEPDDHDLDLVVLVGLGKASELTEARMRKLGGKIQQYLNQIKLEKTSIIIDEIENTTVSTGNIAAQIAYGILLRSYNFSKYLSKEKEAILII